MASHSLCQWISKITSVTVWNLKTIQVQNHTLFTVFRIYFAWTADSRVSSHFVCLYAGNTSPHWYFAYMQLIQMVYLLLFLYAADVHYIFLVVSTKLIHTFYPLSLCLLAADIHNSSTLPCLRHSWYTFLSNFYLYTRLFIHFILFWCVCTQLINVFHPSCCAIQSRYGHFSTYPVCVYTQFIHTLFALWVSLYTADSYILSTFAVFIRSWYTCLILLVVSIRSWDTPFSPCAYTQLINTFPRLLCL